MKVSPYQIISANKTRMIGSITTNKASGGDRIPVEGEGAKMAEE